MTKLTWDRVGQRFFETGVDRGVLYTKDGFGVAWNGLTAVKEAPSGGEPIPYYMDGVKYLNVAGPEEFEGTIEAYTYPDEFAEYEGISEYGAFALHQQGRRPFSLSYRTRIGNDITGETYGYKIHLVYNALASPTDNTFTSLGENVDPMVFSWAFTTTPARPEGAIRSRPLSHISIDSRKLTPEQLQTIESFIYGNPEAPPKLPTIEQIFDWIDDQALRFKTVDPMGENREALYLRQTNETGDLLGWPEEGLYVASHKSRLVETSEPGLYTLES